MFDVVFGLFNPFPPLDPRRPLNMLYLFIVTYHCPKGILGLKRKASKNKLKDTSFIFPMTNITILSTCYFLRMRRRNTVKFRKWKALLSLKF